MPVDTVMWDVGGVLIPDSDPAIIGHMCYALDISEEQLTKAWAGIIQELQVGTISENVFWDRLGERLGKNIEEKDRNLLSHSFNATMDVEVRQVLLELQEKNNIKLCILSDTIPQHAAVLQDAGVYDGFDPVCLSPAIGCSKKGGSPSQNNSALAAFRVACLRAKKLLQQCLFLDDRKPNVRHARRAGMKAGRVNSAREARRVLAEHGLL